MATVHFKVTVWEAVSISDDKLNEVIEEIKNGTIQNSNDLFDCFEDDTYYEGIIDDTMETMTLEENNNQSTIEVLDNNGETICTNEKA